MMEQQSLSSQSSRTSFGGDGLYCPAQDNPSKLSFPASLFIHHDRGYYVKLRVALRNDIGKKLLHYLKLGDVFSYTGGSIKIASKNTVDIYDALHKDPIGSVFYKPRYRKKDRE